MDAILATFLALSSGISGMFLSAGIVIIMVLALVRKDAGLMALAAVLSIPVTYVMGTWTLPLIVVRLMPLFLFFSAIAISSEEGLFAWILPLPVFAFLAVHIIRLIMADFTRF
jgi:hypothetical protein